METNDMGLRPPIPDLVGQELEFQEGVEPPVKVPSKHAMWPWAKWSKIFGKSDHDDDDDDDETRSPGTLDSTNQRAFSQQPPPTRPVGVVPRRQATFRRQNSEKREHLLRHQCCPAERRALSSSRHTSLVPLWQRSKSSPPPTNPARASAPAIQQHSVFDDPTTPKGDFAHFDERNKTCEEPEQIEDEQPRPPRPPSRTSSDDSFEPRFPDVDDRAQLNAELDNKWILNLSMHFRDKSDREKFFVTYAQYPNRWRRVTVSCDYRNAEPGSLEMDLKELQYQRDKSMQIYESIRDSLPDIQFYDTVTNLKLETSDGRLHVHVTEDTNEIIPYPQRHTVSHILENSDSPTPPMEVRECDLEFESHLSGFVYKVKYDGKEYIKKEIPGPDTVDEFLYEINALHDLHDTDYVIRLEAIVVDDSRQLVKGLLISYAERGALVDLLYDFKGQLPWEDRIRWAEQAVRGLSQIHEEGYVQGDFTLSNIVVDGANDAKIIDINRRGCPVGWEPPEIAKKIASNQRISMYIGEKSDIYQLGMTLWALAMDDDEPERHDPPLSVEVFPKEVPEWYRNIVRICLAPKPRDRLSATDLVRLFPPVTAQEPAVMFETRPALSVRTNSKQYIDPAAAVERDDIQRYRHDSMDEEDLAWTPASSNNPSYTYPRSSNCEAESGSSYMEKRRGRSPPASPFRINRGLPERARSPNEELLSPLEHDDRQLHIVTPLADQEYYDYVIEGHDQPILMQNPDAAVDEIDLELDGNNIDERVELMEESPLRESVIDTQKFETATIDDIGPELLGPTNSITLTSESTPRNAASAMESSTCTKLPPAAQLDLAISDLAGCGGHPCLEDQSPHEPKKISTLEEMRDSNPNAAPPPLPFGDSGYEEPSTFDEDNGLHKMTKKHDFPPSSAAAKLPPATVTIPLPAAEPEMDSQSLQKVVFHDPPPP